MADQRKDAVAELSGGQQQRVLIARALVSDPELLILDEPTAGVDLASQQIFADAIRERVARGTTVVMVSHDLGPMDALIDRSVVLRRGRIVYDGPPHASQTHAHVHPPTAATNRGGCRDDLFELEFMQRALIAGLLTGLSAPAIGTYLVQRRLSLMGDGIGHIAITGVALGLLTGTAPVLTAVLVSPSPVRPRSSWSARAARPAATSRSHCSSTAVSRAVCCSSAWPDKAQPL